MQAVREAFVEHGVIRNEREVIDRIFVMCLCVGDHCGKRRLAACAGRGGRGNEQRRAAHHAKQATHFFDRLVGAGNTCPDNLGAVHGGTAADNDDGFGVCQQILSPSLLDVVDGRIGRTLLINRKDDVLAQKGLFQRGD